MSCEPTEHDFSAPAVIGAERKSWLLLWGDTFRAETAVSVCRKCGMVRWYGNQELGTGTE